MQKPDVSRRQFATLITSAAAAFHAPKLFSQDSAPAVIKLPPAFHVGEFTKIYDPSTPDQKWYINDHTFIHAKDGTWHLFGITHPEPSKPQEERFFAHATAPHPMGPWTRQEPVMQYDAAAGESLVWAPYVMQHDGLYYMFYCGGNADHGDSYRIHLATSKDLFHWQRSPANPLLIDGFNARDPMVLRVREEWVLYYTANATPEGGNHTVKAVVSKDLLHWEKPREVFRTPSVGTWGGPTESPFVVHHSGKYYLFVCTNRGYSETAAYVSDNAFHWEFADVVGVFPSHAAEIVATPEGKWYVSRAGWHQGGVYLAELNWV